MDYTAIIVSLIALIGTMYQTYKNTKAVNKANTKKQIEDIQKQVQGMSESQKYILQDRLLHLCKKYLEQGYVPTLELKSLSHLYSSYHNLGGNEFITELFERTKDLPIKERK